MVISIQRDGFSADEVAAALNRAGAGAVVTFTGIVRGESRDGKAVVCVEWDVYESMARREFEAIRSEAIEKFGLRDAAIVHRCGRQKPGENLVFIAAASPHRREAFEACAHIMDEIKKRAPLWKKEIHADGGERWIEG